jgi:Domain of unknown function (DUF5664)
MLNGCGKCWRGGWSGVKRGACEMSKLQDQRDLEALHKDYVTSVVSSALPATKPSNPKDAMSFKKVPFISVLPMGVMARVALGMLEGALKYSRHNYRIAGVRASVYVDAAMRHLASFWEGENLDPESKVGLHHIDKAIASLTVLRDSMLQKNWTDDRPPKSEDKWLDEINGKAAELVKQFPNPPAPCTQVLVDSYKINNQSPVVPT